MTASMVATETGTLKGFPVKSLQITGESSNEEEEEYESVETYMNWVSKHDLMERNCYLKK